MAEDSKKYGKHYNETSFWSKVKKCARRVGEEVMEKILALYYALMDNDTPAWAKSIIIGALGYLILPIDAVPDAIPVGGLVDDAGVITAAIGSVAMHIKKEHWTKAKSWVKDFFGS